MLQKVYSVSMFGQGIRKDKQLERATLVHTQYVAVDTNLHKCVMLMVSQHGVERNTRVTLHCSTLLVFVLYGNAV